jgi:hypothetical protein
LPFTIVDDNQSSTFTLVTLREIARIFRSVLQ